MSAKKSIVATVAIVMTATTAGSYASSTSHESAASEQAVVRAQQRLEAAQQELADAEVRQGGAGAGGCVTKGQVRRMRPYQSYAKVRRILHSKGHRVGSKTLRGWNTCYDTEDLYLSLFRRGGKLFVYDINTPQAPFV